MFVKLEVLIILNDKVKVGTVNLPLHPSPWLIKRCFTFHGTDGSCLWYHAWTISRTTTVQLSCGRILSEPFLSWFPWPLNPHNRHRIATINWSLLTVGLSADFLLIKYWRHETKSHRWKIPLFVLILLFPLSLHEPAPTNQQSLSLT
jgi:hypothetical protein